MNARFLAIVLSFFAVTLQAQAEGIPPKLLEHQTKLTNKIDLNRADLSTLTGSFKGIGKKRAEALIAYRESHQGFKSLEELAEVKGFGQGFVEKNRDKLNERFIISK
jgi:competence protein ComEA